MRRLVPAGEKEPLPSIRECLTHNHYLPASAAASVLVRMGDGSVLHHGCPACAGIDPNGHVRRGFRASYSTHPKAKHLAVAPGLSGFPAVNDGGRGCRLSLRRRSRSFRQGKGQQAEQGSTPGMPTTDEEIHTAALQFVRKISGYRKPSRANEQAFSAFCS